MVTSQPDLLSVIWSPVSGMSLYEALALIALFCAGSYAYFLYRSDTRPRAPGQEAAEPVNRSMFGREPQDRNDSP